MSVTSLLSFSRNLEANKRGQTGSGYKTLSMLFLWVSLRTGSSCKTWPLLVLLTEKEEHEEDPGGGWSLVDLPFHKGLPVDMPL